MTRKRTTKHEFQPFTAFKEIELNPRPVPLTANRTATYASAVDIRVRFLHAMLLPPTALHPDQPMLELANVADISLHPAVAKRLLFDLQSAIQQYESRMGTQESLEELEALWTTTGKAQ